LAAHDDQRRNAEKAVPDGPVGRQGDEAVGVVGVHRVGLRWAERKRCRTPRHSPAGRYTSTGREAPPVTLSATLPRRRRAKTRRWRRWVARAMRSLPRAWASSKMAPGGRWSMTTRVWTDSACARRRWATRSKYSRAWAHISSTAGWTI